MADQRVEYAVRYTAPSEYAGQVAHIRTIRSIAEGMARQERENVHYDVECEVVERTVAFGEWRSAMPDTPPPSAAGH